MGKESLNGLREFLKLPNGIPSHDTFGRIFAIIESDQLEKCFLEWVKSIAKKIDGEVIAIDGKTVRHSFDRADEKSAIHMVSAWAHENQNVL